MWGDANHRIVCMVRADVTDMLTAERQSKEALEEALATAREASRAKSDFLSFMSHDIRTPMNAIMGMTSLAMAHLDDVEKVKDYLDKISISSSTGLGLSITKGLVDLMGGTVTVDSRIREGTRFSVELEWEPVDGGGEMITEEVDFETLRALSLSGRCFLVAEDNSINAEIIGELLTMNGARCVIKTDGREAVREYIKAAPGKWNNCASALNTFTGRKKGPFVLKYC